MSRLCQIECCGETVSCKLLIFFRRHGTRVPQGLLWNFHKFHGKFHASEETTKKYDRKTFCTEDDASSSTNEQPSQGLQSKSKHLNTDLCVFCQQQSREVSLPFSKKLLQAAQKDNALTCRLTCVNDLVAGDVRYHLKCYVKFTRKSGSDPDPMKQPNYTALCLERVAHETSIGITRGEIYNLMDVLEQ